MGVTLPTDRGRKAFTLVELLVVIVIIGMLAGLITGAAIVAKNFAQRAALRMDIAELEKAFKSYESTTGEYPPDFTDRPAVVRHLRKAFPNYDLRSSDPAVAWNNFVSDVRANYYVTDSQGDTYRLDPNTFDAATAVIFWTAGLPEALPLLPPGTDLTQTPIIRGAWLPAGFSADATRPFQPGTSRTGRLFDAVPERICLIAARGSLRLSYLPPRFETAPYVYFRARRDAASNNWEYGFTNSSNVFTPYSYMYAPTNVCRPYLDGQNIPDPAVYNWADPATRRNWRNRETFQIICAGMDENFGADVGNSPFRFSRSGFGFAEGDFDNISNFSEGRLEDEIR